MASARYTRYISKDDNKEPEHHEMTNEEKWSNFWFYHKWHIVAIICAAAMIGMFVYEIVTRVQYDYTIGLITEQTLPSGTVEALKLELERVCDDFNGNGKVDIDIMEYNFSISGDNIIDPNMHAANITRLMGDIQTGQSMLFLTDNVKGVQEGQMFLAYNDGTTPKTDAKIDYNNMGRKWTDCPLLKELNLGYATNFDGEQGALIQDIMKSFTLVKRAYYDTSIEPKEKLAPYYKSSMALFDKLTE